ncbi:DUF305 domain-containing protein [Streptomyces viridochromogenes]|uniref:Putative Secreted protein n=1 Tax=Streptomyces viridochromogenes Tue57 TaxID=1160705 RepID=L8PKA7_STRVR|nr:DUF305 domain-containing protein [Streptomyces viridochromogenes]ELS56453.1 putative Secreted protein [Streptomyces viridochromogenes Tue57]
MTEPDLTDSDDVPTRKASRAPWAVAAAAVLVALGLLFWLVAAPGGDNSSDVPTAASADAGFARDMAVHHQQAVELSYIVRDRTDDEDVRRLAYDIAQTQANQRGMLLGWLDLWSLPKTSADGYMAWMKGDGHMGHETTKDGSLMPGMATTAEIGQLGKASGKEAEILYLQLMTDHHMGGVTMARGCAEQCEVSQERQLAQGMVQAQQSEMQLMADMLKERGSAPR